MRIFTFIVYLLAFLVLAPRAQAQTGQTAQIPLQFDFLNPGARSLGLGSAFVAVADDATATFTNPAGLTQLVLPEFSLELRYRKLDTPYLAGGRLSGALTQTGIDTISGPDYGISSDSAFRPYFFSVVYPSGPFSFAGYRHELVLQDNSFISQGAFFQEQGGIANARQLGLAGERKITIDNYGASAAYRVSQQFSVGAGVSAYRFDVTSDFGSLNFPAGQFSQVDLGTRGLGSTTTQSGSATKLALNAGALYILSSKARVGVVYRQGVSFDFAQVSTVPGRPVATSEGEFRTPSVIGFGVRIQPAPRWSFAADYNRIQYSRLTDDFIRLQVEPAFADAVSIPDGNEFHFGGEYAFVDLPKPLSVRAGIWYDPKHAVQFASDGSGSPADLRLRATFPGGENVWHYCAGLGIPLSEWFEFNVGGDFAKERRYVSASVVYRLRK